MGYRSEVAYAVVFKNSEDRDKVLSRITPEQQQIIKNEAVLQDDRILFHDPAIKWYLSRELAQYNIDFGGYPSVDAHDALIQAARDAEDAYTGDADLVHLEDTTDTSEGVYSLGIFIRLGEEDDDTEKESWGQYDAPEGFPDPWDLVDYRREIVIGWA